MRWRTRFQYFPWSKMALARQCFYTNENFFCWRLILLARPTVLCFDVGIYVNQWIYEFTVSICMCGVCSISTARVNSFHRVHRERERVVHCAQMCSVQFTVYVHSTVCLVMLPLSLMLIVNLTLVKNMYLRYVHLPRCVLVVRFTMQSEFITARRVMHRNWPKLNI